MTLSALTCSRTSKNEYHIGWRKRVNVDFTKFVLDLGINLFSIFCGVDAETIVFLFELLHDG